MIDTIRKGLGTYTVSLPHPFCKLSTPLIENLDTPLVCGYNNVATAEEELDLTRYTGS